MTLPEPIARCEREIQQCREAAAVASNAIERYGLTWAEVDWIVAKQVYEELAAAEIDSIKNREGDHGHGGRIGC